MLKKKPKRKYTKKAKEIAEIPKVLKLKHSSSQVKRCPICDGLGHAPLLCPKTVDPGNRPPSIDCTKCYKSWKFNGSAELDINIKLCSAHRIGTTPVPCSSAPEPDLVKMRQARLVVEKVNNCAAKSTLEDALKFFGMTQQKFQKFQKIANFGV